MNDTTNDEQKKTSGCGIIAVLIIAAAFLYFIFSPSSGKTSDLNPCFVSEDFIRRELNYPEEAEFPMLDCNITEESGNTFTILRKIKASNAFGVKKAYIYKVKLEYNGGESSDSNNWSLINIRSEEYKN